MKRERTGLSGTQQAKVRAMATRVEMAQAELNIYLTAICEDRGLNAHGFDMQKMEFVKRERDGNT